MKIESMRKRYETAKKAVEQVNRMEDLHQSASIDLEDALVDLDELIAWAERALSVMGEYLELCGDLYDAGPWGEGWESTEKAWAQAEIRSLISELKEPNGNAR